MPNQEPIYKIEPYKIPDRKNRKLNPGEISNFTNIYVEKEKKKKEEDGLIIGKPKKMTQVKLMQKEFYSQQDLIVKKIIDLNLKDKPKNDEPSLSAWELEMQQREAAQLQKQKESEVISIDKRIENLALSREELLYKQFDIKFPRKNNKK